MNRTHSIGTRVAFAVGSLIAVILLSIFMFVGSSLYKSFDELIKMETLQIVEARASEVRRFIDMYTRELHALSIQPILQTGSEQECEAFINSMTGRMGEDIANVLIVWPDGRASTPSGVHVDVRERDYFKAVFTEKKALAIGAPVVSKGTGKPCVILGRPITEAGGGIRAMICFELALTKFSEITAAIRIGKTGYGWVIDNRGIVIAFPKSEAILNLNITEADEKNGYSGLSALAVRILESTSTVGNFIRNDKAAMSLFSVEVPDSPGWRLGINVTTKELRAPVTALNGVLLSILLLGLLVSLTAAFLIGNWIAKPIKSMAAGFRDLAEGEADLTKRIGLKRNDEIGTLIADFDRFLDQLSAIIAGMKSAQGDIDAVSGDLESVSNETGREVTRIAELTATIRERIRRQAEGLEDASSAVGRTADGITALESLITDQSASIVEASASIEQMVGNIGSVTASVERIAMEYRTLSASSERGRATLGTARERVAQIADQSESLMEANEAIGAIASQTNLLAMNAAIEAAHAGEAGKGFSVVADEIRRLAETAGEQSRTIGAKLNSIQESIRGVVEASEESEKAFEELSDEVATTDSLVSEVKAAMSEQKEGSTQILEAIKSMNDVTARVRTSSLEMSAGNKTVTAAMTRLKETSREIDDSSGEIEAGMQRISSRANELSAACERNERTVARMETAVGRFKT